MLFNHDAEKSVIGALLQDEGCLRFLSQLSTDDFDKPVHQEIYTAICAVRANKESVDVQTVSNELAQKNMNYSSYLIEACRWVPTTANAGSYVRIVLECSSRRTAYRALREGADKMANGMNNKDDVIQGVRDGLKESKAHGKGISFSDAMNRTFDMFDRAMKGESGVLKYGIPILDAMTGGLWQGQNIVLAGDTGTGKSAFAMEVALNNIRKGKNVMICSREMTVEQYSQRIWSRMSGVDLRNICDGSVGDGDLELLMDKVNEASCFKGNFLTDVYSVEELRAIVEADTPDLLVVDYLQLMDTKRKVDNEVIRLGTISLTLKQIALEYNIPVLSLSQLRRSEGRAPVMPQKKDLRGSGNIEQDADVIIFLHQPAGESDPYVRGDDVALFKACKASDDQKRYIAIDIAKQRQGRLGTFQMIFEPSIMRWTQIERSKP